MTYDILRFPVYAILVLVLGYNLSQRRHLEHGEKKRFASLKIAGIILLFAILLYLIQWFELAPALAFLALALVLIITYLLRSSWRIYRIKCTNCSQSLPISKILYYDDNLCPACTESLATLEDAGVKSSQFPSGVPATVGEIDWPEWIPDETAVLCFVRRDNEIMLIRKKTGLGAGKINGPGGRIEPNESAHDAAIRETIEETGVTPEALEERAQLSFIFTNGYSLHVTAFIALKFSGTPAETREADPFWCDTSELPFDRMWEDDREWLPRALAGEILDAKFIFDGERMISEEIVSLDKEK